MNTPVRIQSTTGTAIETYIDWLRRELDKKNTRNGYGEIAIRFVVCRGQVTDVRKESIDTEHTPLRKENDN